MTYSDFGSKAQTVKTTVRAMIALGCGIVGCAALGKTVALWPLSGNALTGEQCLRSAVHQEDAFRLGAGVQFVDARLGWNLPANPDNPDSLLFDPVGGYCARVLNGSDGAGSILSCTTISDELLQTLYPQHDHTVEGWVKFDSIPSDWWVVWYPFNGSGNTGGVNFTLRRPADKSEKVRWILYVRGTGTNALVNDGQFGAEILPDDITNRWMHIALTFKYNDPESNGKSAWRFYMDGVQHGSALTHDPLSTMAKPPAQIEIGGRSGSRRAVNASFAYWRVSDECLSPEGFLNCGGTGTVYPPANHPTVAYWKLEKDAFGGVSGVPSVGSVHLDGALFDAGSNFESSASPSSDCAFLGAPPNSSIAFPDGNFGSLCGDFRSCYLRAMEMGRQLTVTNSFTIEGWCKPRRDSNAARVSGYIFSTREKSEEKGWALQFAERVVNNVNRWELQVFAQDSEGTIVANSATISGDLTDWHDWKHVAIVYDAEAEGKGVWTCYLDGVQCGRVVNASKPVGDVNSKNFQIGGRAGQENTFYGNVDCVRVTKAILTPAQFLNATEGAQPVNESDILALYPLNARNGLYMDGTDLKGGTSLTGPRAASHMVVASDATPPAVSNPDTHPGFRGDPVHTTGSAGFRTVGGDKSYLATQRSEVRDVFTQDAWTLEGFFKRTQAMTGDWEVLFATVASISLEGVAMQLGFSYRQSTGDFPNGGFILYADSICGLYDRQFPGTNNQTMPVNEWQHIALSYEKVSDKSVWKLYLNGVYISQLEGTLTPAGFSKPNALLVGGRPTSNNSFKGCIANVRLSKGALTADQLLGATNVAPVEPPPRTLAYWPLDANGETVDVADRVEPSYQFQDIHSVVAQAADRARPRPSRPDASPSFVGDPRANNGSVDFSTDASHVSTHNLGLRLDMDDAFTVEGWMKWKDAVETGVEYVAGTFRQSVSAGWRFGIDHRGAAPKFSVFAKGTRTSVLIDKCFDYDISALKDVWTHVALTYRPRVGNGTWTLFVDGREIGSVENDWGIGDNIYQTHIFRFGAYDETRNVSFVGSLDMWRVSQGVLKPEDFLFQPPRGSFFIFR